MTHDIDSHSPLPHIVIAGTGRAGSSFAVAAKRAGWRVTPLRHVGVDALTKVPEADVFLLCVPDAVIGEIANRLEPTPQTVVAHCAGSVPIAALERHPNRAGIHPMVSLGGAELGATALMGAWCGCAWNTERGQQKIMALIEAFAARPFTLEDDQRSIYHTAAAVASNHLVALSSQVERLAIQIGVPTQVYWELMQQTMSNIAELGPKDALTGPVSRGDWETVKTHLAAIDASEHNTYLALAQEAARLAERDFPKM